MVALAEPKTDEKGIDLGSGDGRIVIEFAKKGVEMLGIELDEILAKKSQTLINQLALSNAKIKIKDFWQVDLSPFDIITIYPMPDVMAELEAKMRQEAKSGARILTNYYPLPTWETEKSLDHVYLYRK